MKSIPIISAFLWVLNANAQYHVSTEDIPRFWETFDLANATTDSAEQVRIIQTNYLDKGTVGLKEFNSMRDGTAINYREFINQGKKRLQQIRPYTLSVQEQKKILDEKLARFKELYPGFREGDVYFTIGIGNSGGTVKGNHVLIGCEVMANEKKDWAISIALHEFVHTQQVKQKHFYFLSHCLMEGAADFIMELVNGKPIKELNPKGYIAYGLLNEDETWDKFKQFMFSSEEKTYGWLYGKPGVEIAGIYKIDMGYYMGYRICKSYYDVAADKSKAIKEIIRLKYNPEAARKFIIKSGYVQAADIDYVSRTLFRPVAEIKKEVIKKVIGVMQSETHIIFQYEAPKQLINYFIDSVCLAGSFNDWNPQAEGYKMELQGENMYTLQIPKQNFEKGKQYTFKFVINGNEWLIAPPEASNNDGSEYNNLSFTVK